MVGPTVLTLQTKQSICSVGIRSYAAWDNYTASPLPLTCHRLLRQPRVILCSQHTTTCRLSCRTFRREPPPLLFQPAMFSFRGRPFVEAGRPDTRPGLWFGRPQSFPDLSESDRLAEEQVPFAVRTARDSSRFQNSFRGAAFGAGPFRKTPKFSWKCAYRSTSLEDSIPG